MAAFSASLSSSHALYMNPHTILLFGCFCCLMRGAVVATFGVYQFALGSTTINRRIRGCVLGINQDVGVSVFDPMWGIGRVG